MSLHDVFRFLSNRGNTAQVVGLHYMAGDLDTVFYHNCTPRAVIVRNITCWVIVQESTNDVSAMVEKLTSGTAPGSGTDLLTAAFQIDDNHASKITANTYATGTLVTTPGSCVVAPGEALCVDFSTTLAAGRGSIFAHLIPAEKS